MSNPNVRIDPELGNLLGPLAGLSQPAASFKVPKCDDTAVSIDYLISSNIKGLLNSSELTPEQVNLLGLLLSHRREDKR